jgi:hypothetical protein
MIDWFSFLMGVIGTLFTELVLAVFFLFVARIWMLWKGSSPLG